MSLAENVFCTTEEVWTYLNPSYEDRDKYEGLMETWLNAATQSIESHLQRHIKSRRFDTYQNGNGLPALFADNYPILHMHTVEVYTPSFGSVYQVSPVLENRELVVDRQTGLLQLLPNAPVGCWFKGAGNVHLVYESGFSGYKLDVFKPAIFETIETFYRDMGANPRLQQLNESVGNSYFTGRFDPSKLSHQVQMLLLGYRCESV